MGLFDECSGMKRANFDGGMTTGKIIEAFSGNRFSPGVEATLNSWRPGRGRQR